MCNRHHSTQVVCGHVVRSAEGDFFLKFGSSNFNVNFCWLARFPSKYKIGNATLFFMWVVKHDGFLSLNTYDLLNSNIFSFQKSS